MSLFGNSILAGSAGQGPSADLGDTIDQSLRFGDTKLLTNSLSALQSNWTLSVWFKYSLTGPGERIMFADSAGGSYFSIFADKFYWWPVYGGGIASSPLIRDPSAWYHLVIKNTSSGTTIYLNGSSIITGSSAGTTNYFNKIGGNQNNTKFVGYMADLRVVDGSALTPTSFGRTNDDGVWVPQDYTGTYGTNGFHLTFDSSQTNGIGHDSSGNGNHFTASGFDEGDVALWSSMLYSTSASSPDFNTTTKSFTAAATFGFNGSTSGTFYVGPGNRWVWRPNTAIPNVTLIEVYTGSGDTHWVNESAVGNSTTGGTYNTVYSGSAITLSNLAGQYGSGSGSSGFAALRINGVVYVDNTDNDVDYNDTPTSNYTTLNPLFTNGTDGPGVLSKGNLLQTGGSHYRIAPGTISARYGKYYWEAIPKDSGTHVVGIIRGTGAASVAYVGLDNNNNVFGFGYLNGVGRIIGQSGTGSTNGNILAQNPPSAYGNGDVIGMAIDIPNGTLDWYKNGSLEYQLTGINDEDWIPAVSTYISDLFEANFGQHPFIYTPPAGFEHLQTNNLPEPTIKNGKDHFDVLTWTGDGASPKTRTGLEFTPDLIWIKERNQAYSIGHRLYDSVRGAGVNKHLNSSSSAAEGSGNDEDYGYVTGFVEGGFTTINGTSGSDYVNNSSNNYVAWCWKAGGTAVSNTDGTITSSVSANTDAGFSIVSYTGNGTAGATVGHGLNEPPEFMIFKSRTTGDDWSVYHKDLPNGSNGLQYLILSASSSVRDTAGSISQAPTSDLIRLNGNSLTNASGTMIAYCWHSIPGYSAFGSYTGNSNANGPFVYTGFRPAFILYKCSSTSSNWHIRDNSRNVFNPANAALYPNLPNIETANSGNDVDLLSNGFKIRNGDGDQNITGQTWIWAAFAESPFGGENQPPVTAR